MGSRVQRSDVSGLSRLDKFPRTGAGAVRIPATIARTGVQHYPEDGLVEYRPESEVFAADSLASLASVPVTLGHPPVGVTPANAREHTIGHVTDAPPEARVTVDGSAEQWLRTTLIVADAAALAAIEEGGAGAVSCGYSCELDMTPGVHPVTGEKYDAIQRNIRFNHVAILTADQKPRAGGDAKVRLDSQGKPIPMKVIVIDGVEYEQGSEKHIAKIQSDAATALAAANSRADKAEGIAAAEKARADKAEAQLTVDAIDARVLERLELLKAASKLLPSGYETAGKSDHQVRVDALTAAKMDVAGKSVDFVSGMFATLTKSDAPAVYHNPSKKDGSGNGGAAPAAVNFDSDDEFRKHMAKQLAEENK